VIVDCSPPSSDTIKGISEFAHRIELTNFPYVPLETIFPGFRSRNFASPKPLTCLPGTIVPATSGRSHLPRAPTQAGQWWRGSSGVSEMAVRDHHHLPLPDGAVDDRTVRPGGLHADGMGAHGQRPLLQDDEVLGETPTDQLRDGCRHRYRAGVPVRHDLELLLPVRRRRVRRAAGDGRTDRLLRGVHVPRVVDIRLAAVVETRASCLRVGV